MVTSQYVLRFPPTLAGFDAGTTAFHRLLDSRVLQPRARFNLELAFEEIAVNIVRHGAATDDIELAVAFEDDQVTLRFEDDGVAFDPRERASPVQPDSLEEAPIGGLGVMLVKRLASHMDYERTPQGRNRLTLAIPAR